MKTVTNHHIYHSLYYCELNAKQKKAVDSAYGGLIELNDDTEFVFYRNWPYFMGDCMRLENDSYWHGYFEDTFFSRIVVHIDSENDGYIFGIQLS